MPQGSMVVMHGGKAVSRRGSRVGDEGGGDPRLHQRAQLDSVICATDCAVPGFGNTPFSLEARQLMIRPELYSMAIFARNRLARRSNTAYRLPSWQQRRRPGVGDRGRTPTDNRSD